MKILLFKTILLAAAMGVGTSAWGETIGNTSDDYLAAKSTSITLTDGGSVRYVFSQTTANTAVYQGFILAADKTDDTQLIRLRQDFWENIAVANTGCTANYPDGWVENYGFFNGATVDMTVTYNSGTFTMSSTIYGSDNGEYTYGYTKTIDGAPSSIVVYLSNDHAQLMIGKTSVTNGTVTTTTYDFQSMGTATLTASSTSTGNERSNTAYVPNELSHFLGGRFAIYFVPNQTTTVDPSNGLKHVNSENTGRAIGILMSSCLAGDKIVVQDNMRAGGPSNISNCNMTIDGVTVPSQGTTMTAGATYYAKVAGTVYMQLLHNKTIKSINVVSNSSDNYSALFSQWETAASYYANEEYTEGRSDFITAITTAKAVIDDVDATEEKLSSAYTALREASEYFYAINSLNTSYRVSSSSVMSNGTNVKSVYGITMTYKGSWSWTENRNGNAAGTIVPTLEHNMPIAGDYWEFKPTVDGTLTIKAAWFADQYYELTDENGNIIMNYRQDHNNNDYNKYENYGSLIAGKTYYFFRTSTTNGYYLGGFTFTPGENNRTSYTACNGEIIKGGYIVNSVAGITMTYGGTSADTWSYATDRAGAYLTDDATVSGSTPTGNTYLIFNPVVNGILTINNYFFLGNGNCHLYLSDGSNVEDKGFGKGSGSNGNYTNTLSTILKAGDTYYVYFADGYGYARFQGFTFTPTPATIPATIGGTGFATFSSEYPLDFSATTTKAYAASLTGDNTVLLSPVTAVPANTGLLLKGATEDIPVKAGFGAAAPATNLLKASEDADIAASVEGTYHYVLANGSKGVGFYNLAAAKNIGTGKAYLETTTPLAAASEARVAWIFADDAETTGIDSMNIVPCANNKEIFNLNGQRVDNPTRGLYIVNGKKVIIK